MAYCGYITRLRNVRPHPNADRLQLADCFGNTVCLGLDAKENDLVCYFPVDGQLSEEFCAQNNLVRKKDENGNNVGGFLDPNKRNITAIKLRGEKSDGLVCKLEDFAYTGVDINSFKEGDPITTVNGHLICTKYIPKKNPSRTKNPASGKQKIKPKVDIAPTFLPHVETEQLAYNLGDFEVGDEIEISLKLHGTSARTGYLPVLKGYKDTFGTKVFNAIKTFLNKFGFHFEMKHDKPLYEYDYITGTRRTILAEGKEGFYGNEEFRMIHADKLKGKLHKGETVYGEIVGFTTTGQPIMGTGKVPKEYQNIYGDTMTFTYGCVPGGMEYSLYSSEDSENVMIGNPLPQSDFYVYRITMTNPDGEVVEYSPDFMRTRCEQIGVKSVPVFRRFIIPNVENPGEYVKAEAEKYYDGPDPIGVAHVREGVVVRIVNRPKFTAYKIKNFLFKVIAGIAINNADTENMSEEILSEM